jgi:hypothetical protein
MLLLLSIVIILLCFFIGIYDTLWSNVAQNIYGEIIFAMMAYCLMPKDWLAFLKKILQQNKGQPVLKNKKDYKTESGHLTSFADIVVMQNNPVVDVYLFIKLPGEDVTLRDRLFSSEQRTFEGFFKGAEHGFPSGLVSKLLETYRAIDSSARGGIEIKMYNSKGWFVYKKTRRIDPRITKEIEDLKHEVDTDSSLEISMIPGLGSAVHKYSFHPQILNENNIRAFVDEIQ